MDFFFQMKIAAQPSGVRLLQASKALLSQGRQVNQAYTKQSPEPSKLKFLTAQAHDQGPRPVVPL